jgi:hypothetical protein
VSLNAPTFDALTYVIGTAALVYEAPAWITTPAFCAGRVEFNDDLILVTGNQGTAAIFDGTYITIHYTGSLDIAGANPAGITYDRQATKHLNGFSASANVQITIKNPCLDPLIYKV